MAQSQYDYEVVINVANKEIRLEIGDGAYTMTLSHGQADTLIERLVRATNTLTKLEKTVP